MLKVFSNWSDIKTPAIRKELKILLGKSIRNFPLNHAITGTNF